MDFNFDTMKEKVLKAQSKVRSWSMEDEDIKDFTQELGELLVDTNFNSYYNSLVVNFFKKKGSEVHLNINTYNGTASTGLLSSKDSVFGYLSMWQNLNEEQQNDIYLSLGNLELVSTKGLIAKVSDYNKLSPYSRAHFHVELTLTAMCSLITDLSFSIMNARMYQSQNRFNFSVLSSLLFEGAYDFDSYWNNVNISSLYLSPIGRSDYGNTILAEMARKKMNANYIVNMTKELDLIKEKTFEIKTIAAINIPQLILDFARDQSSYLNNPKDIYTGLDLNSLESYMGISKGDTDSNHNFVPDGLMNAEYEDGYFLMHTEYSGICPGTNTMRPSNRMVFSYIETGESKSINTMRKELVDRLVSNEAPNYFDVLESNVGMVSTISGDTLGWIMYTMSKNLGD